MRKIAFLASLPLMILAGCRGSVYNRLNKQAEAEYLQPVRPASEGRNPCWNKFAKKFMYAPAFDVPSVSRADKYRFTVKGSAISHKWREHDRFYRFRRCFRHKMWVPFDEPWPED